MSEFAQTKYEALNAIRTAIDGIRPEENGFDDDIYDAKRSAERALDEFEDAALERLEEIKDESSQGDRVELLESTLVALGVDLHELELLSRHTPNDRLRHLLAMPEVQYHLLKLAEKIAADIGFELVLTEKAA